MRRPLAVSLCGLNCGLWRNERGINPLVAAGTFSYSTVLSVNTDSPNKAVATRGNQSAPGGRPKRQPVPPRTEKMAFDQDWSNVYPTATVFKPSAVPLPIRMGYPIKRGVAPEKKGNLELVKIPNFLHLTPTAIKKHCAALKDFCTDWPVALDTDEKCEKYFPIEIQSTDYLSAGPSLRNPKARVVTLSVSGYCFSCALFFFSTCHRFL
uniref:Mitochondrial ribosomal protein S35 n=1 Tax=Latimeria chalumnae TaxID=7897 RepID=H3AA17_LATCH